jgi:hypothetical protein
LLLPFEAVVMFWAIRVVMVMVVFWIVWRKGVVGKVVKIAIQLVKSYVFTS